MTLRAKHLSCDGLPNRLSVRGHRGSQDSSFQADDAARGADAPQMDRRSIVQWHVHVDRPR